MVGQYPSGFHSCCYSFGLREMWLCFYLRRGINVANINITDVPSRQKGDHHPTRVTTMYR